MVNVQASGAIAANGKIDWSKRPFKLTFSAAGDLTVLEHRLIAKTATLPPGHGIKKTHQFDYYYLDEEAQAQLIPFEPIKFWKLFLPAGKKKCDDAMWGYKRATNGKDGQALREDIVTEETSWKQALIAARTGGAGSAEAATVHAEIAKIDAKKTTAKMASARTARLATVAAAKEKRIVQH